MVFNIGRSVCYASLHVALCIFSVHSPFLLFPFSAESPMFISCKEDRSTAHPQVFRPLVITVCSESENDHSPTVSVCSIGRSSSDNPSPSAQSSTKFAG